MNNQFKVEKSGKYFNVIYIGYKAPNNKINWRFSENEFQSNKLDARRFIDYVCNLNKVMDFYIDKNNLDVNPKKVIRMNLSLIEAISSGLDIRSKWDMKEVGDWLVDLYLRKRNEANDKCGKIIQQLRETPTSQAKHWRKLEECDDLNEIYELGYPETETLCTSTFNSDLESIIEKADEMLELLIKSKKEEKLKKEKNA